MNPENGSLEKIGKYQNLTELGRGGMGVVYKGLDPYIERTVAIKTIRVDLTTESKELEKWKKRFLREAQLAGKLAHPNIVTIYDVGEDSGIFYIAMEYIEGQSLRDLINPAEPFSLEQAQPLMEQICNAMSYAHKEGVLHCDLKPENILINKNGNVVIVDFGIARPSTSDVTRTTTLMVSPSYAAPEQLSGEELKPTSDIFSLGAIFYELLTGQKAFRGQEVTEVIKKIISDPPAPPTKLVPELPEQIDYVIQKALAKNPEDRYQSCDALYEDIVNYHKVTPLAGQDKKHDWNQETIPVDLPKKHATGAISKRRSRPYRTLYLSLLAALVIVGSVLVYSRYQSPGEKIQPTAKVKSEDIVKDTPPAATPQEKYVAADTKKEVTPPPPPREAGVEEYLRQGKASLKAQDYGKAIALFGKALNLEPDNPQLRYNLGVAYQHQNQLEKSLAAYKKAAELNQSFAPPYRGLGEVYEQEGNIEKAVYYYEKFLSLNPESEHTPDVREKISKLKEQTSKDAEQAREQEARFQRGMVYLNNKEYQKAINEFNKYLAVDPDNKDALARLKLAKEGRAKQVQQKIASYHAQAQKHMKAEEYSAAIPYFRKILSLDKDNKEANEKLKLAKAKLEQNKQVTRYYQMGTEAIQKRDYAKAVSYFKKVLALDNTHQDAKAKLQMAQRKIYIRNIINENFSKGVSLFKEGDYSKASDHLEEVLKWAPGHAEAKKYYQQAQAELKKKKSIEEHFSAGLTSFENGNYSEAISQFNEVLKLDPDHQKAKEYIKMARAKKMEKKLKNMRIDTGKEGEAKLPEGW